MEHYLAQLRQLINHSCPISDGSWEVFSSIWKPWSAARKECVTRAGETEKYLYFVAEGVQRVVYTDDKNHEATLVFTYAPSFGGVLDSLLLQRPSRYSYETLTPSSFLRAPFAELQKLMGQNHEIEHLINIGLTETLSGVLLRLVELQSFSSEEKYKALLRRSPHILQLVPHKYIANYLGIDPTNFSKFINNVAF